MSQNIALAASGSESAEPVEKFAFDYCLKNMVDEILVIHVVDIHLAQYGEIDPLASGSCKNDFVNYITGRALATSQTLYARMKNKSAQYGVTLNWLQVNGGVLQQIPTIVIENQVSTLIVGAGVVSKTFFAPSKKTASNLSKKCACEVITVPV